MNTIPYALSAALTVVPVQPYPKPTLYISESDLPRVVDCFDTTDINPNQAIQTCNSMQEGFGIPKTMMAKWLGLKRHSFYNWLESPNSSTKSQEIEQRLLDLEALFQDMEAEHRPLLSKIAYSPLYGNTNFSLLLENGANSEKLIRFYDDLYENFEALRQQRV